MAARRGLTIGIALGEDRVVGVVQGRSGTPTATVSLRLPDGGGDAGPELERAFTALGEKLEAAGAGATAGAEVHLTLLPPLADARIIPLPPMRRAEVESVLTRDVSRYFLGGTRSRVLGVRVPNGNGGRGRRGNGASVPVLAAAAPLAVVEAAGQALARVGWTPRSYSTAHGAWLAAAEAARGTPVGAVVAAAGGTAHVFRLEGADPVAVRQLSGEDARALVDAVGPGGGRAIVLGSPQDAERISTILGGEGWVVSRDPAAWASAEEAAAARAAPGRLELVPPALALEREDRNRRWTLSLLAAAVVLVLASAGAHLWGAYRELHAIQAERAEIRARVAPLLEARDSLDLLRGRVETVEELSRTAPLWTRTLVELSALLPVDTYLTGFFASGDTVEIEAAGAEAARAIQALRGAGLFEEVRLQGIVERELEEGETVEERFSLRARLPARRGGDR